VRQWTLKKEGSVRAVMVVVVHELIQHPSEMTLADHDDVIETLPADGLHKPFCDRVRFRRPRWRPDSGDAWLCRVPIEVAAVHRVPIVDEMDGLATPWSRFQKLLPDPCRRRTGGDVEMDQLTAVVTDEEEDVQDPVVNGVDDQEIGCPLASGPRRLPPAVSADGAVTDDDRQLEQFAANALGTPEPVLLGDPGDEILNLAAESRAAESGA